MLASQLQSGLDRLSLSLTDTQQMQLLRYVELLQKWNRSFNLTAVREPPEMVTRHLLDSLAISVFLPEGPVLDAGTGAGLPGLPLAIARPGQLFVLLDSNGKKTRFLQHVVLSMALSNVEVVHSRVEAWESPRKFAVVTSRAFASLDAMIRGCGRLLADDGQLLAMKGHYPQEELEVASARLHHFKVVRLSVPDLDEERCLVIMNPVQDVSDLG